MHQKHNYVLGQMVKTDETLIFFYKLTNTMIDTKGSKHCEE
jgi:hypothetical protein